MPEIPGVVEMEPIGKGGMGVVYKGTQAKLERPVAIKVLGREFRSPQAEKRFLLECKHLARLDHDNVVRCYDSGVTSDGEPYMVMEFVDGPNLSKWTASHGPLSVVDALRVCRELTDALEHGLDKKLIHRDVKPENVLLKPNARSPGGSLPFHVKLADFGLSRSDRDESGDTRCTQPGEAWGSPHTMAPEQFVMFGSVDFRADLYALGCILHFTLTGRHAFADKSWEKVCEAKTKGPPPDARTLRADIPESVACLLQDMLQPDPDARPPSYAALIQRIDEILARIDPSHPRVQPRVRKVSRWMWAAGILVIASISGALAWGAMRWKSADDLVNGADPATPARIAGAQPGNAAGNDVDVNANGASKHEVDRPPAPRADSPTVRVARDEITVKAGSRAFLTASGEDSEYSSDQLSFTWRVVEPEHFELELGGQDTPTLTFWAPEPPEGRDYDIVLEVVVENGKHVTSPPARVTVHVTADEKTRPLVPGQTLALFRSQLAFEQGWSATDESAQAFVWNDDGQVHGAASSGRKRIELELPRGSWKLSGKVRLERGSAPVLTRGRVILEAFPGAEVAIEMEASREDSRGGKTSLAFRGFGDLAARSERIADTDYVTFEAVWNGKELAVKHAREDVARKLTSFVDLPASFDAKRTGRPVKLCIEVEGAEILLQDFVLSGPVP